MTTWIALCLAPVFLAQMGPADEQTAVSPTVQHLVKSSASESVRARGDDDKVPAENPKDRRPLLLDSAPRLSLCADAFQVQAYRTARDCYRLRQNLVGTAQDKKVAAGLAKLAAAMMLQDAQNKKLHPPAQTPAPKETSAALRFVAEGGAELTLLSSLYGFYLGVLSNLMVSELRVLANPRGYSEYSGSVENAGWTSLMILTPLIGGLGAGSGALAASLKLDDMSAGDANLIRSSLLMIPVNQLVAFYLQIVHMQYDPNPFYRSSQYVFYNVLGYWGSTLLLPGVSILAAAMLDLPDGGVSLANSAAIWGAVLAGLSLAAFPKLYAATDPYQLIAVLGVADVAWLGTLIAAPWMPKFERHETWALDLGAALGLGAGAALAFGLRAPSPLIGWGTLGLGVIAGGAAGFATAHYAPAVLKNLEFRNFPKIIALSPTLIPAYKVEQEPALALAMVLAL